jgi:hypothetical protein
MLPPIGILLLLGLIFPFNGVWAGVVLAIAILATLRLRQLTVLGDEHVEVTVIRTHRIPWREIEGFDPGTSVRGGMVIRTADGEVQAVAPCSWWGGPASADDLETLERVRAARVRKR